MNVVVLLGRITHDLQIRYNNDLAMLGVRVAVDRRKKGETDFINCQAFGKTAENIAAYFRKGSRICVRGHIQTGSYQNKEGKTVYTTDVIIDEFDFVDSKSNSNDGGGNRMNASAPQGQYAPQQYATPQMSTPNDDFAPGFQEVETSIPF